MTRPSYRILQNYLIGLNIMPVTQSKITRDTTEVNRIRIPSNLKEFYTSDINHT